MSFFPQGRPIQLINRSICDRRVVAGRAEPSSRRGWPG